MSKQETPSVQPSLNEISQKLTEFVYDMNRKGFSFEDIYAQLVKDRALDYLIRFIAGATAVGNGVVITDYLLDKFSKIKSPETQLIVPILLSIVAVCMILTIERSIKYKVGSLATMVSDRGESMMKSADLDPSIIYEKLENPLAKAYFTGLLRRLEIDGPKNVLSVILNKLDNLHLRERKSIISS
jgi:hypothetical protein